MAAPRYDVLVVGGSVAGCIAALAYARRGLRVAVLERSRDAAQFKQLCTHFIQPMALPVLQSLELDHLIERHGGVRTRAAVWTEHGWIDPPGDYNCEGEKLHAYNIERRVLDPLLRSRAAADGVDLHYDGNVTHIERADGGWRVTLTGTSAAPHNMTGTLLVAADGRRSCIAKMLGNVTERHDNERAAYFGYFEAVRAPDNNRSLFLQGDDSMGFVYPLGHERVLLAAYVPKELARQWRATRDLNGALLHFMSDFPDIPDLSRAQPASRLFGYADYPNLGRRAVCQGVPFIGDAAVSLDPMSGVGCGFAIVSAHLLAAATFESLLHGRGLDASLERYEAQFNATFLPHCSGIRADSLVAKSAALRSATYRRIVQNPSLQSDFLALTGRLISPQSFQRAYLQSALQRH